MSIIIIIIIIIIINTKRQTSILAHKALCKKLTIAQHSLHYISVVNPGAP